MLIWRIACALSPSAATTSYPCSSFQLAASWSSIYHLCRTSTLFTCEPSSQYLQVSTRLGATLLSSALYSLSSCRQNRRHLCSHILVRHHRIWSSSPGRFLRPRHEFEECTLVVDVFLHELDRNGQYNRSRSFDLTHPVPSLTPMQCRLCVCGAGYGAQLIRIRRFLFLRYDADWKPHPQQPCGQRVGRALL